MTLHYPIRFPFYGKEVVACHGHNDPQRHRSLIYFQIIQSRLFQTCHLLTSVMIYSLKLPYHGMDICWKHLILHWIGHALNCTNVKEEAQGPWRLLGHLLVKIIPVTYQLSSTKIPKYLSQCTEWPQTDPEHLTVKSTLYTLNTYPWGPPFAPFRSTISRFRDTTCTRSVKIGNALNDPKLNSNT